MRVLNSLGVTLLMSGASIIGCATDAQTTYDIYFLGGQSNMDGYGYVADLPRDLRAEQSDVMIFQGNPAPDDGQPDGKGIWTTLRPGHGVGFSSDGVANTYSDRFGVELTFAQHLRRSRPGAKIALIKYSRGGTSIDTAAAGAYGSWEPDYGDFQGINQYDHFLATVRYAMAVKDIDGDGIPDHLVPKGIVWMQGESDAAVTEDIAKRYQHNLTRLIDLIRSTLRAEDLPVVIGRISDSGRDSDGKMWDHGELVRAAQASFVEDDGAAALVTTTDNYEYSDPWHYDSKGYMDLGRRFADAMVGLIRER